MSVHGGIGGSAETGGNDVAEKERPDLVSERIGLIFVKSQEQQCPVHERGVVQEGRQNRS